MGRKAEQSVELVDKTTYKGRWKNRHDVWKKVTMPKQLVDYIVETCKVHQEAHSSEIQSLLKQYVLK